MEYYNNQNQNPQEEGTKCIMNKHLDNEVLDVEKYRVYKSSTILQNTDRLLNSCELIRDDLVEYLGMTKGDKTTTWKHAEYNFFSHAMYIDSMFIKVWEDLIEVIKQCSPKEAKYAWIQSWLNYDSKDTVENNLSHHAHNCPIHGYIAIHPQSTKTVFDEWEIENEVGNIYCGLGKWKHHVENTGEYSEPRVTIGYDVVFGDLPWEGHQERYQSLPWHAHWIPIILKD